MSVMLPLRTFVRCANCLGSACRGMAYQTRLLQRRQAALRFLSSSSSPTESESSSSSTPFCNVIDVAPLANEMRAQVRRYTRQLATTNKEKVRMVGILAEAGPYRYNAECYNDRIASVFAEDGIAYDTVTCSGTTRDDVEATIRAMNARNDVTGILTFYPIFPKPAAGSNDNKQKKKTYISARTGVHYKTDDDYLRDIVHPSKDVEGLTRVHHHSARTMFRARSRQTHNPDNVYIPCTALAVTRILDAYALAPSPATNHQQVQHPLQHQKRWSGCTMTIINRSEILGRPLAALLALQGATVYSVDEHSILVFLEGGRMRRCDHKTLEDCVRQSSVIVTGVPTPDFVLPSEFLKRPRNDDDGGGGDPVTIVNVSEFSNVDEAALLNEDNDVTINYIPQVGKVTVAALEENLVRLHRQSLLV